jgi:hypothetical protein
VQRRRYGACSCIDISTDVNGERFEFHNCRPLLEVGSLGDLAAENEEIGDEVKE